jgi:hypothetical protein
VLVVLVYRDLDLLKQMVQIQYFLQLHQQVVVKEVQAVKINLFQVVFLTMVLLEVQVEGVELAVELADRAILLQLVLHKVFLVELLDLALMLDLMVVVEAELLLQEHTVFVKLQ